MTLGFAILSRIGDPLDDLHPAPGRQAHVWCRRARVDPDRHASATFVHSAVLAKLQAESPVKPFRCASSALVGAAIGVVVRDVDGLGRRVAEASVMILSGVFHSPSVACFFPTGNWRSGNFSVAIGGQREAYARPGQPLARVGCVYAVPRRRCGSCRPNELAKPQRVASEHSGIRSPSVRKWPFGAAATALRASASTSGMLMEACSLVFTKIQSLFTQIIYTVRVHVQ